VSTALEQRGMFWITVTLFVWRLIYISFRISEAVEDLLISVAWLSTHARICDNFFVTLRYCLFIIIILSVTPSLAQSLTRMTSRACEGPV